MNFLQDFFKKRRHKQSETYIHTDLANAVTLIVERRKDNQLVSEVNEFLEGDMPSHFNYNTPVFYFSRYISTPDYETLFYIDQVKRYNYPIIIGEDSRDILTSHQALKRNLVKLPVIVGESRNGNGIIQYKRVADLNSQQGKQFNQVELLNGKSLLDLHHYLSKKLFPGNVLIADESEWVSRNSRGELTSLYEKMLALLIVHGIMLEIYEPDETGFLQEIVIPAMKKTEERFGHKPFIAKLEQKPGPKIANFNSYPKTVLKHITDFNEMK